MGEVDGVARQVHKELKVKSLNCLKDDSSLVPAFI